MGQNGTEFDNGGDEAEAGDDGLSPAQELALDALLAAKSVVEAAQAAGVSRTTLHRWLRDDCVFIASLNESRGALHSHVRTKLLALASAATETVERAISEGDAKTAVALLRGMGCLPGFFKAGPTNAKKLKKDRLYRDLLE